VWNPLAISGGLVSHAGQNVLAWPNLAPVSDSDLNQQGLLISSGMQAEAPRLLLPHDAWSQ